MSDLLPPNILFIVWDACRADYAKARAPTFRELAADNVSFEKAIAPSNWSPPSHASLFSGTSPSEHGTHQFNDRIDAQPLLESLNESYRTYSVSANGFASHRTGFHEPFDETHYTRGAEVFQDGLGVYDYGRASSKDGAALGLDLLRGVYTHDAPIKSVCNIGSVAVEKVAKQIEVLQRVPHPLFSGGSGYTYTGARNNHHINRILELEASTESPFFLFSNFMDTHRPYKATADDDDSFSEIRRLNESVAPAWQFLELRENNALNQADLKRIRGLYENEVESVDEYLAELLEVLGALGLREDTLIVVTADHGENLGEKDDTNRVRMGHEASMSSQLVEVPLVIAHPDLDDRTVTDPVSLNDLYDLFVRASEVLSGDTDIETILSAESPVFCESPAVGAIQLFDRYPDAPESALHEYVNEDAIVSYWQDWRVLAYSTGETHAWHDGEPVDFKSAPDRITDDIQRRLNLLAEGDNDTMELSKDEINQLESLGYL
jgi:arylsulfatase A-like enzyme